VYIPVYSTGEDLDQVVTTGVEAHVVSTEHTIEHEMLWNIGGEGWWKGTYRGL
jgi:hypothetical protein